MATDTIIDPSVRTPVEGAKNRTEGHVWLHRLVGEWTYESESIMPDGSTAKSTGTERVRKLGEYWVVMENVGTMPDDGKTFEMVISVGYDTRKGCFVGSWVGSMMESLWIYDGELDENGTLILNSEGEDMMNEDQNAPYQDRLSWESDDVRVFASYGKGPDGEWFPFMTVRYTRVK